MFNKYNLIIALILVSSFVVGYKRDDISLGLKKIFSNKEVAKPEAQISKEEKQQSSTVLTEENGINPPSPAVVLPLQQNPESLGKTLDSISAGTIPEEQIRKHQEYLKNITTKLKDFQGGEANIPVETPTPSPTPLGQTQIPDQNQAPNPSPVPLLPQSGNGFEQQTPLNPVPDLQEETDDAEDPDEADDTESDDEAEDDDDEEAADTDETDDVTTNLK